MAERSELVRVPDQEALEMLDALACEDLRQNGKQVAWLIRQEYARRYSTPQPVVTVAEAQAAAERQA
jgi:hypothetical protein